MMQNSSRPTPNMVFTATTWDAWNGCVYDKIASSWGSKSGVPIVRKGFKCSSDNI